MKTPVNAGTDFELAPTGWQVARCYAVIDLGTHVDEEYGKEIHRIRIYWELPLTKREDGKPFMIASRYTFSHHEKSNLRKMLESWYGKKFDSKKLDEQGGFDMSKILERPAFINVTHSEDGRFANIGAIGPLPDGMTCPPQVNKTVLFSLAEFDQSVFDGLPQKTKELIMKSGEYLKMTGKLPPPAHKTPPELGSFADMMFLTDSPDDIPF